MEMKYMNDNKSARYIKVKHMTWEKKHKNLKQIEI